MVSVDKKNVGIAIDKVIEKREILVRPLSKFVKHSKYVAGTAVVEDSIIPILDVRSIVNSDGEPIEQRGMTKENVAAQRL